MQKLQNVIKIVLGTSRTNKQTIKQTKKGGLYNTHHEPLSDELIVKKDPDLTHHTKYHPKQYQYL